MKIQSIRYQGEELFYVADSNGMPKSGGYFSRQQAEDVKAFIESGRSGPIVPKGIRIPVVSVN
jgi:hypothetical protein